MKKPNILIFEVTLLHTHPAIWRIVEVKSISTLHDLHRVIQVAMGWQNAHAYSYSQAIDNRCAEYILPEFSSTGEVYLGNNPKFFKLKNLFLNTGDNIKYLYDFGDYWEHNVILKGRKTETSTFGYPACTAGAMACPPEDVGGIHGYNLLVEAIQKRQRNELAEYKNWLGYHYNPYHFSAESLVFLNKTIRRIK